MSWRRQKFTFMVIPDSANSQVVRFQLSASVMISALILLIVLAVTAVVAMILYGSRANDVARLKGELTASAGNYEKIIGDKQQKIGDLQTEVAGFSEQAKSIQGKMTAINKLESQLKEMAGIGSAATASAKSASVSDGKSQDYAMDGGAGGADIPVTDTAMDSLLEETRRDFTVLDGLIAEMKPRLEETKHAVLQRQEKLRITPTIWPADSRRVTSLFGVRRDPFTHRARFHSGLDISGDTGDPIYAAADGTVVRADLNGSYGNSVQLNHGNEIMTTYSHLSKMLVQPGMKVKKGELIARMGTTGRSTGPHLHYEILVKGTAVDPKPYLQASRKEP